MNPKNIDEVRRVGSTAQRLKQLPYDKRVCRIEAHYPAPVMPGEPFRDMSVDKYVEFIDEVGLEVSIVSGETNRGTPRFRSKMIPPHPNVNNDLLPKFLERAHQKGIIVLSYYSFMYNKPLKNTHEEWLMEFLDDGRPPIENLGWFCFNSPFRDWLPQYLIEFLDNLDIDGFYFDDSNWGSHEDYPYYPSCCCEYCEKLFLDETGLTIPRKVDFDSIDFKRFVNWRYDKLKDALHHIFGKVKDRHPDAILDLNTYYWPANDWRQGHPLNSLHLEDVGGHFFVESITGSLREPALIGKILRSTGTPFAIFRNTMQELKGFGGVPYCEPYPPAIFGVTAIANGGQPCGYPFSYPIGLQKDTMKTVFQIFKERKDYIEGETVKYALLHYSQQNRDFRPSELAKNLGQTDAWEIGQKDAHGAYEMLNRSHILLDIVLDERLNLETLDRYRVLFLSNSACLSERQCRDIRSFVRNGGTLIASHETSLLDEMGQKRDKFALSDVLGVEYQGPRKGEDDRGIVYVPKEKELIRQFGPVICFYSQESKISIRPDSDVEVLCTRSLLEGEDPLVNFDSTGDYDSIEPAVTENQFGKGKAIYISGDIGGAYMNSPYSLLKRFVANLVNRTRSPIEIEAPEAIEVTASIRPSGELMVHMVNNPTPLVPWRINDSDDRQRQKEAEKNFLYINELIPIHNIRVRLNDFNVKTASLPLSGESPKIGQDLAHITIPKVDLHEVLLIDLQE